MDRVTMLEDGDVDFSYELSLVGRGVEEVLNGGLCYGGDVEKLFTMSDSEPGVVVFGAIVFEESFPGFEDGRERDGMMIGVLVCDGRGDIRPHAFVFTGEKC